MSYDTSRDTITVANVTYDVERATDGDGDELLTIEDFPGIEGRLGYERDASPNDDPRDWSNVGAMFCEHDRYKLGDEDAPDPRDQAITCPTCEGDGQHRTMLDVVRLSRYGTVKVGCDIEPAARAWAAMMNEKPVDGTVYRAEPADCPTCEGDGEIAVDIATYLRREHGARVILPLFLYDHSGITMRAGAPIGEALEPADMDRRNRFAPDAAGWDTSSVGIIFDTPEGVRECMGDDATDEQIEHALRGEVKVYASYLEGDITFFSVDDDETNFSESCGGFVGDREECERQCFAALESAIGRRLRENVERAEMAARDIITV